MSTPTTHHEALIPMLVVLLVALLFSAAAIRAADREIDRLRARVAELESRQWDASGTIQGMLIREDETR